MLKPIHTKRKPFTEPLTSGEQDQVRQKAHAIWKARKDDSKISPEDDWSEAIVQLKQEHSFPGKRLRRFVSWFWQWTGLKDKTLWDLMQVLLVPLTLAIVGVALQEFAEQRDVEQQEAARQREQELAEDRARQETLVKYLAEMSDLLNKGLLKSPANSEKVIIAQAKTIIALQSLDARRQHLITQFLHASNLNTLNTYGLLHKARMSKVTLVGSDLSGAVLIGANLTFAKFGCLSPHEVESPNRQCSDLSYANLGDANLRNADFSGVNLNYADLSDVSLNAADLRHTLFYGANLSGAELIIADLSNADFGNANLSSAEFSFSNLERANLWNANLNSADLYGADLYGANFSDADLSRADLRRADLSRANFSNADLNNADLSGAILLATNLSTTENLELDQLTSPEPPFLCITKLPAGMESLSDRDCDRLPQELLNRHSDEFKTLEEVTQYIDELRMQRDGQSN